jgi:hypothetical protein
MTRRSGFAMVIRFYRAHTGTAPVSVTARLRIFRLPATAHFSLRWHESLFA